jgi:hypothetical protein
VTTTCSADGTRFPRPHCQTSLLRAPGISSEDE